MVPSQLTCGRIFKMSVENWASPLFFTRVARREMDESHLRSVFDGDGEAEAERV